jgi:hypothetical protein
VADHGDPAGAATGLSPGNAKAILGVLVGDPLGGVPITATGKIQKFTLRERARNLKQNEREAASTISSQPALQSG